MRIAFMGTPDFAVPALNTLYQNGHEIAAVYCQPPRPSGRGRKITPCAVQVTAEQLALPVYYPTKLKKQPQEFERFKSLDLDIAIVAAYGLILPEELLNIPRYGCLNIHASLLPRWRGASPIQSAIWAGDSESGISIMKMDRGLDTGAVYAQEAIPITSETTAQTLHDQLALLGGQLILQALELLEENPEIQAVPQPHETITYARQLIKTDGKINWNLTATEIDRQIRALTPWPGTYSFLDGQLLKILSAKPCTETHVATPGTLIQPGFRVVCGQNQVLQVLEVQMAGKKRMATEEFLKGYPLSPGTQLHS